MEKASGVAPFFWMRDSGYMIQDAGRKDL